MAEPALHGVVRVVGGAKGISMKVTVGAGDDVLGTITSTSHGLIYSGSIYRLKRLVGLTYLRLERALGRFPTQDEVLTALTESVGDETWARDSV